MECEHECTVTEAIRPGANQGIVWKWSGTVQNHFRSLGNGLLAQGHDTSLQAGHSSDTHDIHTIMILLILLAFLHPLHMPIIINLVHNTPQLILKPLHQQCWYPGKLFVGFNTLLDFIGKWFSFFLLFLLAIECD
jgi:hypothetical protein